MRRKVMAIPLEFGFHEIKKYIHSGFAKRLAQHFDLVWFAIDKGNPTFNQYFKATGFPVVFYSEKDVYIKPSRWELFNRRVRNAWMKQRDLGVFHNYKQIQEAGVKEKFLGKDGLKRWMEKWTCLDVRKRYVHPTLEKDFKKYQVDLVLSNGYASPFSKSFFVTAHHAKLPCYYLVNSWKDLYTDNFIPFTFLKKIFVWDAKMKRNYCEHMPYLKESSISVTGNPTFDVLFHYRPSKDRRYYAEKYQMNESAQWFLYTMMPPGLVHDEIDTIRAVAQHILTRYSSQEIELLIRKNPNHEAHDFINEVLPSNVHIAEHYCRYDASSDMIVQTPEGESEWLDLVFHCAANLSVPSTVTLEFQAMSKPVINIELNPQGKKDPRVLQHFQAGFYRDLFERADIHRVSSIDALLPIVDQVLAHKVESFAPMNRAADLILNEISSSL